MRLVQVLIELSRDTSQAAPWIQIDLTRNFQPMVPSLGWGQIGVSFDETVIEVGYYLLGRKNRQPWLRISRIVQFA